ncbi:MAG: prephenate dehydrogenase/arogenate dehydrogenase family protein [Thermodesulfobacteriota bacterium]|nr:prephenate dehydrogenase/arogenate dehydrogenase family protein [Thermodesulfobacteriota bacterium]
MNIEKIGIIGGKGSMGKWFHSFFENQGYNVSISDLNSVRTNHDIALECDVIILSTPIETAVEIAADIGPVLTVDQIFMDFCSQKEDIVNAMVAHSKAEVVGTHPMFGPFTDTIKGQNIILSRGRGERGVSWARKVFSQAGADVTELNGADHDRHMALVQGLTHLITICMAKTLQKMDLHPTDVFAISTPIFRINSDIMGRLFAQDPDLYTTLVGENKYVKEVLDLFRESLDDGTKSLLNGDHAAGADFIKDIGNFIGEYKDDALKRSNRFLNVLFE